MIHISRSFVCRRERDCLSGIGAWVQRIAADDVITVQHIGTVVQEIHVLRACARSRSQRTSRGFPNPDGEFWSLLLFQSCKDDDLIKLIGNRMARTPMKPKE